MFIVFEGGDGVGKSTQIDLVANYFTEKNIEFIKTREPGGTELGNKVREILLNTTKSIAPTAEVLLFLAARAQHVQKVILPALKANKVVLCDRFADSTIAYQVGGRNLNIKEIEQTNSFATNNLVPNLTILLDLDPQKSRLTEQLDRMEKLDNSFKNRVRKQFLSLANQNPKDHIIVDATKSKEQIFQTIIPIIEKLLQ